MDAKNCTLYVGQQVLYREDTLAHITDIRCRNPKLIYGKDVCKSEVYLVELQGQENKKSKAVSRDKLTARSNIRAYELAPEHKPTDATEQ